MSLTAEPSSPLEIIEAHDGFTQPGLPAVIRAWLERSLIKARYPRLDQAGHAHTRLALAQVFIDIEAGPSPTGSMRESDEDGELKPGIVAEMLGKQPAALELRDEQRCDNQLVVIGGPGQGKSTTSQYLAQIHRAALLRVHGGAVEDDAEEIIDEIARHVSEEMPGWPVQPCVPARIELGKLAAWMVRKSIEPERAVTGFLCEQIGDAQGPIPESDVHALLELVPWLVVFDGLDEVPASGGRDLVVAAIQVFRRLLAERGTPVLMLAMTRPQGYADELGSRLSTAYLQPLSKQRALAYARKLIDLRYPLGEREVLHGRMKEACDEQATARLMHSPLQVTIMAALVSEVGRPPHQRWRLFSEYYRVIYQREMQRPNSPAGRLLRDHRTHIDAIHQQVGLLLQVESERGGGTEALLDRDQLRAVVDRHLHDEGFAENERDELVEEMVQVATDRLVFLVSPQGERYGFEIRSLQEFMAAEALMDGREEYVKARLRRIAPLSLWRNVLLFAAGKCAGQRHMRDFLVNDLLDSLEQTGNPALDSTPMASARLALDLIEDGSFDNLPAHLERLARCAVELLAMPPSSEVKRLVSRSQDKVRAEVRRFFETRWRGSKDELSGWLGLIMLADAGEDWARELAAKHWYAGGNQVLHVLLSPSWWRNHDSINEWLARRILDDLGNIFPAQIRRWWQSGPRLEPGPPGSARTRLADVARQAAAVISYRPNPRDPGVHFHNVDPAAVRVHFAPLEKLRKFNLEAFDTALKHFHPWQPWISAVTFCKEPTHKRLALELEALAAAIKSAGFEHHPFLLPWPLGACLAHASSPDELLALAQRARTGELGLVNDWRIAEQRWSERGIDPVALLSADKQWPGCGLADDFLPHPAVLRVVVDRTSRVTDMAHLLQSLVEAYQNQPGNRSDAAKFIWILLNLLPDSLDHGVLSPQSVEHIIQYLRPPIYITAGIVTALVKQANKNPIWFAVLEHLGTAIESLHWIYGVQSSLPAQELAQLFNRLHQSHCAKGVIALLANWATRYHRSAFEMPSEISSLSAIEDTTARYHLGVFYLAQDSMEPDDARVWIRDLAFHVGNNPWLLMRALSHSFAQARIFHMLRTGQSSFKKREQHRALAIDLLTVVYDHVPDDKSDIKEQLLDDIYDHFSRRASGLDQAEIWNQLGLPAPSPSMLANLADSASGLGMLAQTRIEQLHIHSIRCIEDITIDFDTRPDSRDQGQWIVLVGENGTGKSSILRGLVLALAAPDVAAGLVADSSASLVRTGKDAGEIAARIQGATFRAKLRIEDGREELVRLSDQTQADRPWLFAYGCGRGSALGGPDREVSYTETASVITLFDDKASLLSTETWLKLLQLDALKSPDKHKARLDTVLATLKELLPGVNDIDIDSQGVWLSGENVGERTPLSGLSDGYITTIGWVTDFMARWLDRATKRRITVKPDFPRHMEALVLVDELDLHLHPRWQRHIIGNLRAMFPRVSFVVTTHNPLTLLGARSGEIFVVRRAPASPADSDQPRGPIEIKRCDPPEGLRADQVLTGEWFGLASTLDPDTLELLEQHRHMLREQKPASDPARKALEQRIRDRLGRFAETPLEQLAQEVAAEVLEEDYSQRSPAEKLALRQKFKNILEQRQQGRDNTGE